MSDTYISDAIKYIGVDDTDIDLFESQYVVPNGVSYNSYVIIDEKTAVMDTVDERKTSEWLDNLSNALAGRKVDYLIVSHLEPDHSGSIKEFTEKYPEATPPHLRDNQRSAPPTYTTDDCSGQEIRKSIPSLHPVCV